MCSRDTPLDTPCHSAVKVLYIPILWARCGRPQATQLQHGSLVTAVVTTESRWDGGYTTGGRRQMCVFTFLNLKAGMYASCFSCRLFKLRLRTSHYRHGKRNVGTQARGHPLSPSAKSPSPLYACRISWLSWWVPCMARSKSSLMGGAKVIQSRDGR